MPTTPIIAAFEDSARFGPGSLGPSARFYDDTSPGDLIVMAAIVPSGALGALSFDAGVAVAEIANLLIGDGVTNDEEECLIGAMSFLGSPQSMNIVSTVARAKAMWFRITNADANPDKIESILTDTGVATVADFAALTSANSNRLAFRFQFSDTLIFDTSASLIAGWTGDGGGGEPYISFDGQAGGRGIFAWEKPLDIAQTVDAASVPNEDGDAAKGWGTVQFVVGQDIPIVVPDGVDITGSPESLSITGSPQGKSITGAPVGASIIGSPDA